MSKKIFIEIILISFSIASFAQDTEKQPLRAFLLELEQRYGVSFTYIDEDVDQVFLKTPNQNTKLDDILDYLQIHTGLDFQILSERFISISKPTGMKIDICGKILDEKSGEMIYGATIQSGGGKFTVSDENGDFILKEVNREDTLLIRYLGYEYLRLLLHNLDDKECDTIRLKQRILKLKEITISNFLIRGIDKDAEGKFIITSNSLDIIPGLTEPDVLQTVQALPGIMSIDETVSDINVRGGTNDQNLILWNGIRMYQSGHFFGMMSAFNPFVTREVGLIKNGSSAYLGDAVSGTLDLRTDNHVRKKVSGSAGSNMINADLNISIPLFGKSSLEMSARRSLTDLVQTPTYKNYFDRVFRNTEVSNPSENPDSLLNTDQKFFFQDLNLQYNYNISSRDKLELSFLGISNDLAYRENAYIDGDTITKTSGLEQKSLATGLVYFRAWDENLSTNLQVYLSNYLLKAVNHDLFNDQRLVEENEVLDKGLKIDARYTLSDQLDLFAGYQLSEVGIANLVEINNPEYKRYFKRVLINQALFSELTYSSPSGNSKLRGGIRLNYISKFNKWLIEPRLAFNQTFLKYFSMEVLGEYKSQTTAQIIDKQNEFLGVEKRRWFLSNNEDIPVITSKQVSAGIHYQRSGMLISLEGYFKLVDGIISSSQGFQNQYQYARSTGSYKIAGLDLLINRRFSKVNTWVAYTLSRNDYDFPEFIPPDFPNNLDIRHNITAGIGYHSRFLQVSSGMNWRTGKPFTEPVSSNGDEILFNPANSSRLDNYLRIDLSVLLKLDFGTSVKGELGGSVWNLVNANNVLDIYYQMDNNNQVREIRQHALSLTPNFMFRIIF